MSLKGTDLSVILVVLKRKVGITKEYKNITLVPVRNITPPNPLLT